MTEDFCETLHKIKSQMLSKNQERIPLDNNQVKIATKKVFCHFLAYIINNKDIDYVYLCFKLTFYLLLQEASYQIQQNILHFFNLLFFLQTQLRILLQYMSAKKKNYC